jgi:hypothetical protein
MLHACKAMLCSLACKVAELCCDLMCWRVY